MPTTVARVPLLDPETGRFPDEFAPPSVVVDAAAAAASAAAASESASQAFTSASEALASAQSAEQDADDALGAATDSDSYRALAVTAATTATGAATEAGNILSQVEAARDAINDDRGVPNGLATLDASGRLPSSMLPTSALEYKGTWNASTNVPTLADGTGSLGDMYRVTTAGTRNLGSGNISFAVSDYVIHNGTSWEKADTTDAVSSVAGRTGAVVLTKTDVGLANVDNTSDANKPVSTATQTALNDTVNSGTIVGDNLVLTKVGGGQVTAGNVRGPKGDKGDQGNIGPMTDLTIGSVATGAAGTPAEAAISGVAPNKVLSLVIPQGIKGDKGDKGDVGDVFPVQSGTNVTGILSTTAFTGPSTRRYGLGGAVSFNALPTPSADISFTITVVFAQNANGTGAVTWPSNLRWPEGVKPVLPTGSNSRHVYNFLWDGTMWEGVVVGRNFA